jgi:hypothetical protein
MIYKIQLYILSLWLLFLLIPLQEFELTWKSNLEFNENIRNQIEGNILTVFSVVMLIIGAFSYKRFFYITKGSKKLPKEIVKIENQNYEHLTFLTTYIIPFICFEFDEIRKVIILIVLLFLIGAIYVRTHLFYANPTLALLGYHLYKVNTINDEGLIFISRSQLKKGDNVHHIHLGDNIYFVKL